MELLISFYDNSLIYYPNVFFAVLFFISILGIISVSMGIIILGEKTRRVIGEVKSNLSEVRINKGSNLKQIKRKEGKKISFVQIISVFFARNKIFFLQVIRVTFIRINTALGYIELQIERIIKKIRKGILID